MDSLERVALTTPDLGHRLSAILGIQRLGEVWVENARDFILRGMSNQAERGEAIDFLQRIAQETEPHLSDLGRDSHGLPSRCQF
jgi:hypothetical protein